MALVGFEADALDQTGRRGEVKRSGHSEYSPELAGKWRYFVVLKVLPKERE
jgi:hypothetical protein